LTLGPEEETQKMPFVQYQRTMLEELNH
jgi:hypothetical protein